MGTLIFLAGNVRECRNLNTYPHYYIKNVLQSREMHSRVHTYIWTPTGLNPPRYCITNKLIKVPRLIQLCHLLIVKTITLNDVHIARTICIGWRSKTSLLYMHFSPFYYVPVSIIFVIASLLQSTMI